MKYILILLVLITGGWTQAKAQRDTISLNDNWQFITDPGETGFAAGWPQQFPANAQTVNVPHTWNVQPATQQHYGWAWYRNTFTAPASWKNKNVHIVFRGINHTAIIFLNGKKAGEHIGDGFNKFSILLKDINPGSTNTITVACNNNYGKNKVPFSNSFDWPNDGGIIRPVALVVSNRFAAGTLQVTPLYNPASQTGTADLQMAFSAPAPAKAFIRVSLTEENHHGNKTILSKDIPLKQGSMQLQEVLDPGKVSAWHFDFPNLYRLDASLWVGGNKQDAVSTILGFRHIAFRNGITELNGEPVKLMGVEWTAGSNPAFGLAEPDSVIRRYAGLMKQVNAIFTRVHFQQDDTFYDFCNRNGILVQEEVPLWGWDTPPGNDTVATIAMAQLKAMIQNHYHHPSIMTWGVGNELRGRDPRMKAMIKALIDTARRLDPHRMVSYVSNSLNESYFNNPAFTPDAAAFGDCIMMNEYGGSWWSVPTGAIHHYLDSIHLSYPEMPFFIAEFGLCEPNFRGGDKRRTEDLIYHMAVYESKPYIAGAIYFDLTDYRTHFPGTSENNRFRRRIHGVYDMFGDAKPSAQVLRELSSPVEIQQLHQWQPDSLTVLLYGSIGLPQHRVSGYKLYLSSSESNYAATTPVPIPDVAPGQRMYIKVPNLYKGQGVVTVVRPNGYVVTQKNFAADHTLYE